MSKPKILQIEEQQKMIDISNKFTVSGTKNTFKALYDSINKIAYIWFNLRSLSGNTWTRIITPKEDKYKAFGSLYEVAYGGGGKFIPLQDADSSGGIDALLDGSTDMVSGYFCYPCKEVI